VKKPEPRPLKVVCSSCGLDWEEHGEKPTLETCVELLKAEVAKRPRFSIAATSGISAWPTTWGNTWGGSAA
jgi:hypothetical protein